MLKFLYIVLLSCISLERKRFLLVALCSGLRVSLHLLKNDLKYSEHQIDLTILKELCHEYEVMKTTSESFF